jgi:hypothetical protein
MTLTTPTPTDSPITYDRAEELIRLLTDGLVNIKDKTGQFLLKRESASRALRARRVQRAFFTTHHFARTVHPSPGEKLLRTWSGLGLVAPALTCV